MPSVNPVKLNWIAILVAALACFFFEAIWFSLFMIPWLEGVGRTHEYLTTVATITPGTQYVTAFLCSVIAATVLSVLTQITGPQTTKRGILIAVLVWVGFVATTWAKEYVFEARTLEIYAINAGNSLLGLVILGAITGAWKAKRISN